VWQWTSVFTDARGGWSAPLRGDGWYRPSGSGWYFRGCGCDLGRHAKYLLVAPSADRRGTVGFRCVVDAAA
jgi:gamma-glutamyl hercynylcysteine S-oxide synthase